MRLQTHALRRRFFWLLALPLGLMIWGTAPADAFDIAIGNERSGTYKLGIGISSLVKIKLLPRYDIDLQPLITEGDEASLKALEDGLADFALVAVDQSQPLSRVGMEAVANLGEIDRLTTMLVARRGVDDASVERILESIFENVDFLSTIDPDLQNLNPDSAVMGLTLPLHRGAKRFHASRWSSGGDVTITEESPAAAAPGISGDDRAALPPAYEEGAADARNYVLYFAFDDATLNPEAQATLERAARFAATLDTPAIIVAAYTDSVGDAEYNYLLAERRADSVVTGLAALDVLYGRIDLSLFGERSPWSVTLDDVNEASNRRVELFIEEPVPEVQPLPIPASYIRGSDADSESDADSGPGADSVDDVFDADNVFKANGVSISPGYVPARPASSRPTGGSGVKPRPLM